MYNFVLINNNFIEKQNASISVFDHGFLYGDGVFEGIRIYSGVPFLLREHIIRLYESAQSIFLKIPFTIEILEEMINSTIRKNNCKEDAYIRIVITRGKGIMGGHPLNKHEPTLIIIIEEINLFSEISRNEGINLVTVSTRKPKQDSLNTQAKTLNYLNNQMAKLEAIQAGGDEALVLDVNGYVCEGSKQNIFIIKNDEIITPPVYLGALNGITRNLVITLAEKNGYKVKESIFTLHDAYNADEVFLTGTGSEIVPVKKIDGRTIGRTSPGEKTRVIIQNFSDKTKNLISNNVDV
ncbi:branched-chain-amino-acid transaminase [Psychrobacillus glaciei]|uniref:Branched-chain-amino-acid aminotransferase n=1 Tax=Psychrobacillus glaciei TaxID=2283160 RepID=A0A5J6SQY8_9BACI|nr:branched-chain-amino-acid transaminase [Psychrobacillus glaciei]QFG00386.1 branched-chain-amino-acid transaminase [Psychrobacillus glaciei]